jgi:lipopolysaccharide transport system permease protein
MHQWIYLYRQWLRREVQGRYRGSMLGVAWTLLQPVLQLMVFTLVFYRFMGVRWPSAAAAGAEYYGLQVFIGLAVFNFVAEVLNRSPQSILGQPNLVTKVRFPLVLLPAVTVGAAGVQAILSLSLAMLAALVWGSVAWAWLSVPAVLVILAGYALGLAWWLAALGVYVRDTAQITPALTSVLMFIAPVFYPGSVFPDSWNWLAWANPVAWAMEALRAALMQGQPPDPSLLVGHGLAAAGSAVLGYLWFHRLQEGFSDVL